MNNEFTLVGFSSVSVSGSLAAIIPDTPIVSIAGSTLSEITTTTTSTTTTPTPTPLSSSSEPLKNSNSNSNSNLNKTNETPHKSQSQSQSQSQSSSSFSLSSLNSNLNLNFTPTSTSTSTSTLLSEDIISKNFNINNSTSTNINNINNYHHHNNKQQQSKQQQQQQKVVSSSIISMSDVNPKETLSSLSDGSIINKDNLKNTISSTTTIATSTTTNNDLAPAYIYYKKYDNFCSSSTSKSITSSATGTGTSATSIANNKKNLITDNKNNTIALSFPQYLKQLNNLSYIDNVVDPINNNGFESIKTNATTIETGSSIATTNVNNINSTFGDAISITENNEKGNFGNPINLNTITTISTTTTKPFNNDSTATAAAAAAATLTISPPLSSSSSVATTISTNISIATLATVPVPVPVPSTTSSSSNASSTTIVTTSNILNKNSTKLTPRQQILTQTKFNSTNLDIDSSLLIQALEQRQHNHEQNQLQQQKQQQPNTATATATSTITTAGSQQEKQILPNQQQEKFNQQSQYDSGIKSNDFIESNKQEQEQGQEQQEDTERIEEEKAGNGNGNGNDNSTGTKPKNSVDELGDISLKALLDEAYAYSGPKDLQHKSPIFLELFKESQAQEKEKRRAEDCLFSAYNLGFNRNTSTSSTSNSKHHHNKQGGSLQNLNEAVRNETQTEQKTRNRHNHNSRTKKFSSSSVSSRQREGGSLPSNVNVTNWSGILSNTSDLSIWASLPPLLLKDTPTNLQKKRIVQIGNTASTLSSITPATGTGATAAAAAATITSSTANPVEEENEKEKLILYSTGVTVSSITTTPSSNPVLPSSSALDIFDKSDYNIVSSRSSYSLGTPSSIAGASSTVGTGNLVSNKVCNPISVNTSCASSAANGDCVIEVGEWIDIQQKQQLLLSKVDGENLKGGAKHYIVTSGGGSTGNNKTLSPSHKTQRVVDEPLTFSLLENGVKEWNTSNKINNSTNDSFFAAVGIDTKTSSSNNTSNLQNNSKSLGSGSGLDSSTFCVVSKPGTGNVEYLQLNDNYQSYKSVLGLQKDNQTSQSSSSSPSTTTIFPTNKSMMRHFDENGNALQEMSGGGGNSNTCGSNSSSTAAGAGGVGGGLGGGGSSGAVSGSGSGSGTGQLSLNTGLGNGNFLASNTAGSLANTFGTTICSYNNTNSNQSQTQSQAKSKSKKKSQQERNTTTVNIEKVAGYRGTDPIELLVKYIECDDDNNQGEAKNPNNNSGNNTNNNKIADKDKKKDRKKDREKNRLNRSNSLENFRTNVNVDDDLKRSPGNSTQNVMMRQKGKANKTNSASAVDINKNINDQNTSNIQDKIVSSSSSGPSSTTSSCLGRKSERRSWGTEELNFLNVTDSQHTNNNNNNLVSTAVNISCTKPEKKNKKDKEKEAILISSKSSFGTAGGTSGFGNNGNGNGNGNGSTIFTDKDSKNKDEKDKYLKDKDKTNTFETISKIEKAVPSETNKSSEKRNNNSNKKNEAGGSNIISSNINKFNSQTTNSSNEHAAAISSNSLLLSLSTETEFHVVTKKKKPKKQKTLDDNSNNNLQRNIPGHHINANSNQNTNMNSSGQANNSGGGSGGVAINSGNIGSNNNGASSGSTNVSSSKTGNKYKNKDNSSHGSSNESSQNTNKNKSRRKSTSSVPPSDKSESSDVDSVHSLPIESTRKKQRQRLNKQKKQQQVANNSGNNSSGGSSTGGGGGGSSNNPSTEKGCNQQKSGSGISNSQKTSSNNTTTTTTPVLTAPVISYADIARFTRDTSTTSSTISMTSSAMAAGSLPSSSTANNQEISSSTTTNINKVNTNNETIHTKNIEEKPSSLNSPLLAAISNSNPNSEKPKTSSKSKKNKQEFPELSSDNANNSKLSSSINLNKNVSYSQSLNTATGFVSLSPIINTEATISPSSSIGINNDLDKTIMDDNKELKEASSLVVKQQNITNDSLCCKNDSTPTNSSTNILINPLKHQTTPLQKSKSVDNEGSNNGNSTTTPVYNISNMDQQYPALQKTVKRHSTANVVYTSPQAATTQQPVSTFNFAAAARQQMTLNSSIPTSNIVTSSSPNPSRKNKDKIQIGNSNQGGSSIASSSIGSGSGGFTSSIINPLNDLNANVSSSSSIPTATGSASRKKREKFNPASQQESLSKMDRNDLNSPLSIEDNSLQQAIDVCKTTSTQTVLEECPISVGGAAAPASSTKGKVIISANITDPTNEKLESNMKTTNIVVHNTKNQSKLSKNNSIQIYNRPSPATVAIAPSSAPPLSMVSQRPAVIILNDPRQVTNKNTDFTFGDFNEEEMKFFDDEDEIKGKNDLSSSSSSTHIDKPKIIDKNCEENLQKPPIINNATIAANVNVNANANANANANVVASTASIITTNNYFNDSGASVDAVTNLSPHAADTDAMSMSTSIEVSPNTSFITAPSHHQSNDSGIYPCNNTLTQSKNIQNEFIVTNNNNNNNNSNNNNNNNNNNLSSSITLVANIDNTRQTTSMNRLTTPDKLSHSLNVENHNTISSKLDFWKNAETLHSENIDEGNTNVAVVNKSAGGGGGGNGSLQLETCHEIENAIFAAGGYVPYQQTQPPNMHTHHQQQQAQHQPQQQQQQQQQQMSSSFIISSSFNIPSSTVSLDTKYPDYYHHATSPPQTFSQTQSQPQQQPQQQSHQQTHSHQQHQHQHQQHQQQQQHRINMLNQESYQHAVPLPAPAPSHIYSNLYHTSHHHMPHHRRDDENSSSPYQGIGGGYTSSYNYVNRRNNRGTRLDYRERDFTSDRYYDYYNNNPNDNITTNTTITNISCSPLIPNSANAPDAKSFSSSSSSTNSQYKEVHFRPSQTSEGFTSTYHDMIVDFIESSWNKVFNNPVTEIYRGQ